MDTDKTKDVTVPAQTATLPNAWRIAAPRSCKFELQDRGEAFAFGGIKPGGRKDDRIEGPNPV